MFGNPENKDDKVYFRAKDSNNTFSNSSSDYYRFVINGKMSCDGNVMYLLNSTGALTTQMPEYAFTYLFRGCSNLTSAPELPATTTAQYCYDSMFNGCTILNNIKVGLTGWIPIGTTDWLKNVAGTGTFTCPTVLDTTTRAVNKVPSNWTVSH